ncbi:MORC family CW-type zinc finger protein 3b isoform X1 [Tachysurus vachellii]|uniref:MORC family CW-type zinc finger protein 3b isoform X1 n=2 Tax=Tachysurus vachellii TaxID=175792 RepID=UPI00296B3544|nr:MORC family CW-type zinc finger protein 3b isoform X1 [Tachysurus vachellii]
MATRKHRGIPLSSLNPKFLHTNSTSHTWPFSAIAELIDNAYDPDVRAKQFWIDWTRIKNLDCLSFMDNGAGMTRAKLHKMLSFGYSDKKAVRDHVPVGVYGNGFKSGSMRLGKDAIVFTKTRDSMSVGLLSQSYLQAIKAQQILVPILTFRRDGQNIPEDAASLDAILRHSLFNTEKELFTELRAISVAGPTGSRIIIWNLRRTTKGETEFNFDADKYDIQIRANASDKTRESRAMTPESDYSLRAYCSILYLKPRMQINIRGQKVKTQLISKSLAYIANDNYRPSFLTKRIRITFGFNTKSKEHYGIMMYHKNRLIKAYEKVSCQRKVERKGVGIIGVIECNFLQPTHNKQDFDDTDKYRKTMHNLSIKLEDYWNEIRYMQKKEDPKCTVPIEDTIKVPDQVWVQCDSCLKWRRLPDGFDCSRLPEKWFCNMNHDPQFRSCLVEEELQDQEEEQKSYPKCFKRQKRNSRSLQYEHGPEVLEIPALEAPVNARQLKNSANWKSSPADLFSNSVTSLSVLTPTSYAQSSPMPLINLTALSDSLKRIKRKDSTAEETAPAVNPMPCASLPNNVLPKGGGIFIPTHSSFAANKGEGKWDEMENENNANTDNKESFKTARCNLYQEPFQEEDEWYASEESPSTETQYCTAESHSMEEEEEELCDNNEDEWSLQQQQQDELVEMMEQTVEDKEVCRNELELLRNHCTVLEDERSQLLSKLEKMEEEKASLSSLCDQLKCKMERLKTEKDGRLRENVRNGEERQKLRKLRINLGHLLVSFVPDLDLQQVDFNSDVIDMLLDQVLKEVT